MRNPAGVNSTAHLQLFRVLPKPLFSAGVLHPGLSRLREPFDCEVPPAASMVSSVARAGVGAARRQPRASPRVLSYRHRSLPAESRGSFLAVQEARAFRAPRLNQCGFPDLAHQTRPRTREYS